MRPSEHRQFIGFMIHFAFFQDALPSLAQTYAKLVLSTTINIAKSEKMVKPRKMVVENMACSRGNERVLVELCHLDFFSVETSPANVMYSLENV